MTSTATAEQGALTREWCENYLRRNMKALRPDLVDLKVRALTKLERGVSRETWMVDASVHPSGAAPEAMPLTIRRDQSIGAIDNSPLRFEYDVYERLQRTEVPVARVFWFSSDPEDDPDQRFHYVREHVAGHWSIPHFLDPDPVYDELRIATSQEFLRALAAVHTADWRRAGFGEILHAPDEESRCAEFALEHELELLDETLLRQHPVAVEGIHALRSTMPDRAALIALCKGTNGLGEEIWADGHLVAMSDWESCSLGDPAWDFARCQEMIPTVLDAHGEQRWGWEEALAYYSEISGIEIAPHNLDWYRKLYGLSMFRYGLAAKQGIKSGKRLARIAWNASDVLMMGQIRLAATAGIEPLPAMSQGHRG